MDIILDEITNNTMSELEKTQKQFWNVPRQTGVMLNMFIKMMGAKNALEIGTSNGYSGLWLAKALKETGGHLTTIEFYEKRQSVAVENFKKCGVNDIITPIQGSAIMILENLSEYLSKNTPRFDFVFIDANKQEYVKYFNLIKPYLTPRCMIAADNILSHAEKVKPFVDAIDVDDEFQYEILELPGGLLTAYRG